ncbi:MAG TPA: nitroreductase family deazaflavin-dependent oxidoreductase, partial [Ktedonobacter sp.]|nr:nitroreductase family deazaflavin-dependent oxidoreductase [Ktedonobacter sp.]
SVTELPAQQAAPILKQYLSQVPTVRSYFDATPDSPLEAFEREAPRHPVFQITTMEKPSRRNAV